MNAKELILCIDVGGDSIKAAEFSYVSGEGLLLEKFAYQEYPITDDDVSVDTILDTLEDVVTKPENGFTATNVHVSVSGKDSFVRFVKVPAMTSDRNKIKDIISFEAKQAISFPMNQVVWDYQLIEPAAEDADAEIDAMLVIVKNEDVLRISEVLEKLDKKVTLIEVASTACYNSARASEIGTEQCEMILNIGGRCSTLVFVDGARFFVRTIPIAGNAITQQIAKEFNISITDAEEMKRRHGFVALGGAYEEPESPVAATVSKIVRNTMIRLHGEINRSINLYRATQHGRKPEKLYLAGGTSILPFTPRFFSEKLRLPVEYFNPFQVVSVSSEVNQELLKEVAHLYGETIGLALRQIGTSPIEISLIPEEIRRQNAFRLKRPYFYATAAALLVYLGITYWASSIQESSIRSKYDVFSRYVTQKRTISQNVASAEAQFNTAKEQFDKLTSILHQRDNWIDFFNNFQQYVPPNMWFSRIAIEGRPTAAAAEAAPEKRVEESEDGGFAKRPTFFSDDSGAENPELKQKQESEKKWLNLDGFVYCASNLRKSTGSNEALNLLTSFLKRESRLFVYTKDPNLEEYDNNLYPFNITRFKLSIELLYPVTSPSFNSLIQKLNNPTSESEKESEK